MKVEVDGKDILVNAINYSNKLELLGHYQDVFKPVHENNGEVSQKEFNALLGHTSELAFSNSDNFEKKYKLNEQINILTKILMQYLGLSDKEKKRRWGLAFCVWYWVLQPKPHNQFIFPYIGETPISKQVKEFNSVDDIYDEVACISKANDSTRTMGQEMWFLVPLFANPQYLLNEEFFNLINEFHYIQDYNIPLGKTLDETDAHKLEYFTIIKNEMAVALKTKQDKDAKKN